jgi:hypothetical protein
MAETDVIVDLTDLYNPNPLDSNASAVSATITSTQPDCQCSDVYIPISFPNSVTLQLAYDDTLNTVLADDPSSLSPGDQIAIGNSILTYDIAPNTTGFRTYLSSRSVTRTDTYDHSYLTDVQYRYMVLYLQAVEGLGPNCTYTRKSDGSIKTVADIYGFQTALVKARPYYDIYSNATVGYGHFLGPINPSTPIPIKGNTFKLSDGIPSYYVNPTNGITYYPLDDLLNADLVDKIIRAYRYLGKARWDWLAYNQPDWALICVDKMFNGGTTGLQGWPTLLYYMGLTGNKIYHRKNSQGHYESILPTYAEGGIESKIPFLLKNQIPVIGGKAHPEYSKYPYKIFGGPRNGRATPTQLAGIAENLKLHFTDRDNAAINLFVYQNDDQPGVKNYSHFSQIVGYPLIP